MAASATSQAPAGYAWRAASIISRELSSPVIDAPGQRRRSASVLFPGPHPRSTMRCGSASAMR